MSDKHTGQDYQRKPSANKNIKKLRTISMVCSLTSSWQQWVTENKEKQDTEPSGWAPSWLGGPEEEPKKIWVPKKSSLTQRSTNTSPNQVVSSEEAPNASFQHADKTDNMETKQAVKTVTTGSQVKSGGIGLLSEVITKELLSSGDDIDGLLRRKCSSTHQRTCSNMVPSLANSCTQVDNEPKVGKDRGPEEEHTVSSKDNSDPEEGKKRPNMVAEIPLKEAEQKDSESAVKIKRPPVPMYKKDADAIKINALSKKYSTVGSLKSRWQTWASKHSDNQKLNPFSEYFDYDYSMSLRLQKGQEGYGHPKEGTKTAERAKRAEQHIHREIDDMCYVIRTMADPDPDGKTRVSFGQLFDRYVRISDKVVGILMRARKHGKLAFEGEMLWQGRDDGVIITLLV